MLPIKRACAAFVGGLCILLLLNGCGAPTTTETKTQPAAFNPARFTGGRIYDVPAGDSRLIITVYRGGAMARLGHNHVISTSDIRGALYRHPEPNRSGAVLTIPVESLEVDNVELRRRDPETFDSEITEEAIEDTRRNMLGEQLLDAERYPDIRVVSVSIKGSGPDYETTLRFTVRDRHHDLRIPVEVEETGDRLIVTGRTEVLQSELGLEPYSAMMGALRVRDRMDLEFRITARQREQ